MRSRLHSSALVEAWFDTLDEPAREVARRLRDAVTGAEPGLDEQVKWGNLVFSMNRTHAVAIVVYRDHVNLQVFNGAALRERHPGLAGGGRQLCHLRFALGRPVDADAVRAVVHDSVRAMAEAPPETGPREGGGARSGRRPR